MEQRTLPVSERVHRCRTGGAKVSELGPDRPPWAAPGEIVRLTDQERWGRVALLFTCCGEREVRVEQFGDEDAATLRCWLSDIESAFESYPANLPPRGYPIPKPWPAHGSKPFPGR